MANLNFVVGPGATASVGGAVVFSGIGGNANASITHQFQGTTAGSIQFASGGSLTTTGSTLQGFPFQGTAGLAVFNTGSFFQQEAASDPYGPATFLAGSTYRYVGGTLGPLTAARTYGNLDFQNSNAITLTGAFPLTILNNLSNTSGAGVTIATSGTISFGGNVTANAPLSLSPAANSTLLFNGTALQTIGGTNTPVIGANALLEINNSAGGLTLTTPLTVTRGLRLTQGIITTNATTGLLTMPVSATVAGGSDASYINGPIARTVPNGSSFDVQFPVGKSGNYRPMRLNIATQSNTVTYTGEQIEVAPNQQFAGGSNLTRVSYKRYFQLSPSVAPTGFSGQVTISFDTDDAVNFPANATFVMAKNDALSSAWSNIGRAANTGSNNGGGFVAGSLTSALFSTLAVGSNFSLASTSIDVTINPLPVELTSFTAEFRSRHIVLDWTTASEKNSQHFEVQRSADGEKFQLLAKLEAAGQSITPHLYSFTDAKPILGVAYYRLRQVDNDGQSVFSPVVAVRTYTSTNLTAYPTRTSSTVTLPLASTGLRYRVRNALGQVVLSGEADGGQLLDVTSLPQGLFFLELSGAGSCHTQRLTRE